jgi:hypothetical protein
MEPEEIAKKIIRILDPGQQITIPPRFYNGLPERFEHPQVELLLQLAKKLDSAAPRSFFWGCLGYPFSNWTIFIAGVPDAGRAQKFIAIPETLAGKVTRVVRQQAHICFMTHLRANKTQSILDRALSQSLPL